MTRILGIDPGSRLTGFGLIDAQCGRAQYVESGVIRIDPGPLDARLACIFSGITELLAEFQPTSVAIENVFMHRNAASALKLGQARGAANRREQKQPAGDDEGREHHATAFR